MTSKRADRLRIIKPPMHIGNLRFTPFNEGSKFFFNFVKFLGGFYLICLNEFESATHLLLMYTEDTKRWLEMMSMAFEEYNYLRSNSINEFGKFFK